MAKNIVICCDGTNNQFAGHHTNVIRTYKVAQRSATQITFYDPGVGTIPEGEEDSGLKQKKSIIAGLAFGSGFKEDIQDAYRFLMQVYAPGDAVYIFGFSRGAYTARCLAAMLHSIGLLYQGTENLFRYGMHYWWNDFGPGDGPRVCAEFKATLALPCPVKFLGVWDTVSSVGYVDELVGGTYMRLPHTAHNPSVSVVRHAVAIDERRHFFRQNLMHVCPENSSVKNVWFAGVHSDVGGGYPPSEAGLAKVTFSWMIREAMKEGLQVDPAALQREVQEVGTPPDPLAKAHESLTKGWHVAEWLPSRRFNSATKKSEWRLPRGRVRNVARDAGMAHVWLHESVLMRALSGVDYAPENIPHTDPELRALFNGRIEH